MTKENQYKRGLSRRDALALATGSAVSALVGFDAGAQSTPKRGGVLKVSANANPSSLDPATGGAGSDHTMLFPMYDTLMEWDYETLKPKPGLAESWKFPDPQTLVLVLRKGVTFHDGTQFDAEAVKFNLDRCKTEPRSNLKADLATVASVEATGPMEVTLKLSQPDAALPGILSDRAGMMVSPTALKANGGALDRKPVGAGAYTFVSWTDNERLIMKRNDKYWRANERYLDGIEFAIIPELATGLRSVIAGQNDVAYSIPARQKPVIQRAKNLTVVTGPTVYCIQIYYNWARPPFDDIRIRKALNFAIDRDMFVKATLDGVGEPAYMNLPSKHWAYDPEVAKLYSYDPDKARALLKEANLPQNFALELIGYTDQDSIRREEIIIEQLAKVGLKAKFTNGSIAEMSAAFLKDKKGDGLLSAWTGRPDPSLTYALMYSKDSYFNAGRADVPAELPEALKQTRLTENIDERRKAFAKVQRLVMENALVCPIAFQFELDALGPRVKGFKPNLLGKPKYDGVWLEG